MKDRRVQVRSDGPFWFIWQCDPCGSAPCSAATAQTLPPCWCRTSAPAALNRPISIGLLCRRRRNSASYLLTMVYSRRLTERRRIGIVGECLACFPLIPHGARARVCGLRRTRLRTRVSDKPESLPIVGRLASTSRGFQPRPAINGQYGSYRIRPRSPNNLMVVCHLETASLERFIDALNHAPAPPQPKVRWLQKAPIELTQRRLKPRITKFQLRAARERDARNQPASHASFAAR
jgi:hypothetical protein